MSELEHDDPLFALDGCVMNVFRTARDRENFPGFNLDINTMTFVNPTSANVAEFLLQEWFWRRGYSFDFTGNIREGGVTVIGRDNDNQGRPIWTVYVMCFQCGVRGCHRLPDEDVHVDGTMS